VKALFGNLSFDWVKALFGNLSFDWVKALFGNLSVDWVKPLFSKVLGPLLTVVIWPLILVSLHTICKDGSCKLEIPTLPQSFKANEDQQALWATTGFTLVIDLLSSIHLGSKVRVVSGNDNRLNGLYKEEFNLVLNLNLQHYFQASTPFWPSSASCLPAATKSGSMVCIRRSSTSSWPQTYYTIFRLLLPSGHPQHHACPGLPHFGPLVRHQ
jgi:hypothetical protein